MNLKAEQQRLYELMAAETRCFVRMCDDDRVLWVSDLPRRCGHHLKTADRLQKAGFIVCHDEQAGLWYIDWTEAQWQMVLASLPDALPELPAGGEYHELYALCRLLLMHPAPLGEKQLQTLRRTVKLTAQPKAKMLCAARTLYEEASVHLRQGQPVCSAAGRVLAFWLFEHTTGKETRA